MTEVGFEQRVSLITLAVDDMDRAAAFYEALGWTRVESPDGVIAFDLIGQTLGLYPRAALAEETGLPEEALRGPGGMTLAHNLHEKEEVAALLDRAVAAGARLLKPAQDVFGAGITGISRIRMAIYGKWRITRSRRSDPTGRFDGTDTGKC